MSTSGLLKVAVALFGGTIAFLMGWFAAQPNLASGSFFQLQGRCPQATTPLGSDGTRVVPSSSIGQRLVDRTPLKAVVQFASDDFAEETGGGKAHRGGKGYRMERERNILPPVLDVVYNMVHHPASPSTSELIFYKPLHDEGFGGYSSCNEFFLSRTGSLENMPNKCLALATVRDEHADPIPHLVRKGLIAHLQDMFSHDYADHHALAEEAQLLRPFLANVDRLAAQLRELMGPQETVLVMVLNTGVLDLFVNFLCSCASSGSLPSVLSRLVVFSAQPEVEPVLRGLGVKVFSSAALGKLPAAAAAAYGDAVFGLLMWLKNCAVFVASHAGYHVLFQDVDMVWLRDPVPELLATSAADVLFMDDGARSPRFSPYYFNSGFYLVRRTANSAFLLVRMLLSVTEIAKTHSHQSTLTKVLLEASELAPLTWTVLDQRAFPSGYLFHHNRDYIEALQAFHERPAVFHMCWTESRVQKVAYLRQLGLWMLPDEPRCAQPDELLRQHEQGRGGGRGGGQDTLLQTCCLPGAYFEGRAAHALRQGRG